MVTALLASAVGALVGYVAAHAADRCAYNLHRVGRRDAAGHHIEGHRRDGSPARDGRRNTRDRRNRAGLTAIERN